MAVYEVFIPASDPEGFDITATIKADSWMHALRSGLSRLGDPTNIKNVLCDITDSGIEVTDPNSGRVFRIQEKESEAAPAQAEPEAGAPQAAPPKAAPPPAAAAPALRNYSLSTGHRSVRMRRWHWTVDGRRELTAGRAVFRVVGLSAIGNDLLHPPLLALLAPTGTRRRRPRPTAARIACRCRSATLSKGSGPMLSTS